jgi:SAM-dependent methyltransferase
VAAPGGIPVAARPGIEPFVRHHRRSEARFERHEPAYLSELLAARALLPWHGGGSEIGVGTGRFAGPLGVEFGMDPTAKMLFPARARRPRRPRGRRGHFLGYALVVTTLCLVDDIRLMLREAGRVLRPGGPLVIGLIDRESPLGREYAAHQRENVFYRAVTFLSAAEVACLAADAGFRDTEWL